MSFRQYFGGASYIASPYIKFPYFRKKFNIKTKIKKTTLYISALGFCELYLNNKKITDDLYITQLSQYNKRTKECVDKYSSEDAFFTDRLGYTIYVSKFDITSLIENGDNVLGIILAGGWYRTGLDKYNSFRNYGDLKVCFRIIIEYEDGAVQEVVSDDSCKCNNSFLLRAGIFHEEQDERLEYKDFTSLDFDDSKWLNSEVTTTPNSKFKLSKCQSNKIIKYIKPKLVKSFDKTKIYSLPENITGFPIISGKSNIGDEISCVYSESLLEDGKLDDFHTYKQETKFISDGRSEHYIRFTWHGFQYFSISTTGNINELNCEKCATVYCDIKNTSRFNSNLTVLNFIYEAYIRSQSENFQCGVPTDCPQIERKGYTGDGQLLCDLGMNLFDSKKLYKKWMNDISDAQDRKTGYVHNTAPSFIGSSGGPCGWGIAIINVPYQYYKTFGDISVLKKYYSQMKKYLEFLDDESIDNLVEIHKRKCACLGDWAGPYKPYLPTPFANTCMYVEALYNLIDIAKVLDEKDDVIIYNNKISVLKEAINNKYFEKDTGNYCGNQQASNAFALNIGLGDKRTLDNLIIKYTKDKHFDTGIFGTKVLVKVLFEKGFQDLAVDLLCSKNKISYYSWMKNGATTLWEAWENPRSLNHPMFGSPVIYFFKYILGIKQVGYGYSDIEISPCDIMKIKRAKGCLKTIKGKICVSISKKNNNSYFQIKIPKGVNATFKYKGYQQLLESGENIIKC